MIAVEAIADRVASQRSSVEGGVLPRRDRDAPRLQHAMFPDGKLSQAFVAQDAAAIASARGP